MVIAHLCPDVMRHDAMNPVRSDRARRCPVCCTSYSSGQVHDGAQWLYLASARAASLCLHTIALWMAALLLRMDSAEGASFPISYTLCHIS